ncbi:MAG: hypothetical protein H7343_16750 [Undibacterium sp.]|nr:hypothetical protein [Opitutaceae bacterium]
MSVAASDYTPPAPSHPLHGTWKMIRAELAGEPAHPLLVDNTTVELTLDRYTVRYDGEIADRGRYTFTLGELHHHLMLHGVEGPNAGRAIPAIFQRKGELLRICYGLDGSAPAAFASPPGSQLYLVTYRRKERDGF